MKQPCPVEETDTIDGTQPSDMLEMLSRSIRCAAELCPLRTMQEELAKAVGDAARDYFCENDEYMPIVEIEEMIRNWKPGAK